MHCNDKISLKIKMIDNVFCQMITNAVGNLGLTAAQSSVLGYICKRESLGEVIYAKHIEEAFHMKHPTVAGILQRLEEKQFITVEPESFDKRYKHIFATKKSRENHNLITKLIEEKETVMLSSLSETEQAELKRLLDKIIKNIV